MSGNADEKADTTPGATDTEETRYEKAFLATRRVLDECIRRLMVKEGLERNVARRASIRSRRLAMEAKRRALVRANVAFHAKNATMVPPAPALVKEIEAISKEAVELTVDRATAAALVTLATSALNKFAKIQEI